MRHFNYDEEEIQRSGKVPYDTEPIARSRGYKSSSPKVYSGNNKIIVFLLVALIAFNLVLGVLFFKANSNNSGKVTVENYYDIYNDSVNTSYMVSKALPSSVCIASGFNSSVTSSNISYETFQYLNSKGAGVITSIDKNTGSATIVTCEHVVSGNTGAIYILLFDSYVPVRATYVGGIREKDIAVLKITGSDEIKRSSCLAAEVADSSYISMGDMVLAIGNPKASGFDTCVGYIRKTQTLVNVTNIGYERLMAISAPINSGNSGGGLYNDEGKLIGIVNAKSEESGVDCIAFAIPGNLALSIAGSIERNNGTALKANLGLELLTSGEGRDVQTQDGTILIDTVVVSDVQKGSAADIAGIMENDIIVGFTYHDNVYVDMINMYSFEDHAYNISVGDEVIFTIKHGNIITKKTVVIKSVA